MGKTQGTMEQKSEMTPNQTGSSAAATLHKPYSAQELAEIYMISRPYFLTLDMKEATLNWNLNYIYDFLNYIHDLNQIDLAIEWLTNMWDDENELYKTYDTAVDCHLITESVCFAKKLNEIRNRLKVKFDKEKKKELLKAKMLEECNRNTTAAAVTFRDPINTGLSYINKNDNPPTELYHFAELPDDIKKLFTFDDDETYTLFVNNLRDDVWLKVITNKGRYLDRLRFVYRKFCVLRKDITREQFDKLLHHVIPDLGEIGNLVSAMKKQTDSNDDKNIRYYDSPLYDHRMKCKKLVEVGLELEECLAPVLEKINKKTWDLKSNPR